MVFGRSILDEFFDDAMVMVTPRSHWLNTPARTNASSAIATTCAPLTFKMDVKESPEGYHVTAELPGVPKENIQVTLEDHVLTIQGSTATEAKHDEKEQDSGLTYHIKERSWGSFKRAIRLPKDMDEEGIKASHENGLLNIDVSRRGKEAEKKRKSIEIQ